VNGVCPKRKQKKVIPKAHKSMAFVSGGLSLDVGGVVPTIVAEGLNECVALSYDCDEGLSEAPENQTISGARNEGVPFRLPRSDWGKRSLSGSSAFGAMVLFFRWDGG